MKAFKCRCVFVWLGMTGTGKAKGEVNYVRLKVGRAFSALGILACLLFYRKGEKVSPCNCDAKGSPGCLSKPNRV